MAPCRVGLDTGVLRPRRGHQGRSASSASDPVMLFGLVRGSLGWILMMPAPGAHAESALVTSICLLGLGFLTWVGGGSGTPDGVPRGDPDTCRAPQDPLLRGPRDNFQRPAQLQWHLKPPAGNVFTGEGIISGNTSTFFKNGFSRPLGQQTQNEARVAVPPPAPPPCSVPRSPSLDLSLLAGLPGPPCCPAGALPATF